MKKFISILLFSICLQICVVCVCVSFTSCQYCSRKVGGTMEFTLEPGEKLIEATWKDEGNLWYLTEPMDSDYVPKTKIFKESSNLGIIQGKVIFHERR